MVADVRDVRDHHRDLHRDLRSVLVIFVLKITKSTNSDMLRVVFFEWYSSSDIRDIREGLRVMFAVPLRLQRCSPTVLRSAPLGSTTVLSNQVSSIDVFSGEGSRVRCSGLTLKDEGSPVLRF